MFGNIILNIFIIQTLCTVMQLFKGSYFSMDAAGCCVKAFLTEFGYRYNARQYEFCFTCYNWVEYKTFRSLKRQLIFVKAVPSIVNPVNKL